MSRLTDLLRCELPIQLAPMGSASASPALALAVTAAGGHAVYPALLLPPVALEPVIAALEAETRAFGVNVLVGLSQPESLELAAGRAPYVDFFLAEPQSALVDLVHEAGGVCGWQVESGEEARAAEAAGCDLVIAKGWESGGRKRVLGPALLPLLDACLEAVDIPVVAAGGIATGRGVAAALAAGADGVRVGTRFAASTESDAHPTWKAAIVAAAAEDAVVTEAFNVGLPGGGAHRVLRGSIAAAEALGDDQAGVVRLAGAEVPAPRFGPMAPTAASTGHVEAMAQYAGQSAGAVRAVASAGAIMAELRTGLSRPAAP